jgi:hypothetical protein
MPETWSCPAGRTKDTDSTLAARCHRCWKPGGLDSEEDMLHRRGRKKKGRGGKGAGAGDGGGGGGKRRSRTHLPT